jgi:hypothetical protein
MDSVQCVADREHKRRKRVVVMAGGKMQYKRTWGGEENYKPDKHTQKAHAFLRFKKQEETAKQQHQQS